MDKLQVVHLYRNLLREFRGRGYEKMRFNLREAFDLRRLTTNPEKIEQFYNEGVLVHKAFANLKARAPEETVRFLTERRLDTTELLRDDDQL